MYNIKLYDYVPEPKPVTGDYIVAAHYYAAWKKGAAQIHNGFNDIHDYPERTPLMGYYDEENPAVCDWEIKWATEHGINCFIHCWYRMKYNEGKPITSADLRCGHGLHDAMFNARYQKYMKFAIMFETSPRWASTDAKDLLENLMPFWTETYFKRENYLVVDNKPILFVYNNGIDKAFATPAEQKAAFDACREYAVKAGFDGLTIAYMSQSEDIYERGYDFRFAYNLWLASSFRSEGVKEPTDDMIIGKQKKILEERLALDPMGCITTASVSWSPKPRLSQAWIDQGYNYDPNGHWWTSPDGFRQVCKNCKQLADSLPEGAWGKKIIMIDNWNEWDEGHFVSPSHGYGFKYLQAIREELTHRDNLPDYRMPQDVCPGDYNKSWDIPDFTGIASSDICFRK